MAKKANPYKNLCVGVLVLLMVIFTYILIAVEDNFTIFTISFVSLSFILVIWISGLTIIKVALALVIVGAHF